MIALVFVPKQIALSPNNRNLKIKTKQNLNFRRAVFFFSYYTPTELDFYVKISKNFPGIKYVR